MAAASEEFRKATDPRRIKYRRDRATLDADQRDILKTHESLGAKDEEAERQRRLASLPDRIATRASNMAEGAETHPFDRTEVEAFLKRAQEECYAPEKLTPIGLREKLVSLAVFVVIAGDKEAAIEREEERFSGQQRLLADLKTLSPGKTHTNDDGFGL